MINFFEDFDKYFPEIATLDRLWNKVVEAKQVDIEKAPNKPAPITQAVPRQMFLERDHIVALAEGMGMSPDEIVIVLQSAMKYADNPIIVDAFKKLLSATKLCTDVNDCLAEHRAEIREELESHEDDMRRWKKCIAAHSMEIKEKEKLIASTSDAYRKTWLKLVRELEARFHAAAGDTAKLSEDDAYLYRRGKRGSKSGDAFAFLRNQKGDKCTSLLKELKEDLRRKLIDRGVKKALKGVKNIGGLADVLATLDDNSANYVFDTYIRRLAFTKDEDGYLDLDERAIVKVLPLGLSRGLASADGWSKHLEEQGRRKERHWRDQRRYGVHDMDALSQIYAAIHNLAEADF